MSKAPSARTISIIKMRESGQRQADIARQLGMSPSRVKQILQQVDRLASRRQQLVERYGASPDTAALPDGTPLEVLILCDGDLHGWDVRLHWLEFAEEPIRTLGDLRTRTDQQLRKIPNVGRKMVAELRRLCPIEKSPTRRPTGGDQELERLFAQVQALPSEHRKRVVSVLAKLLVELVKD